MADLKLLAHYNAVLTIVALLSLAWFLQTPANETGLPEPSVLVDAFSVSIVPDARQGRDTPGPRSDTTEPQKEIVLTETEITRIGTDISWHRQPLEPGVIWMQNSDSLFGAPQFLNVLVMDADDAAARFRLEAADRVDKPHPPEEPVRHLTASEFARAFNPAAVINAGFFSDHPEYVNSGIFKVDGEVYPFMKQEPEELRFVGGAAVGIGPDGNWLFRNRENHVWPDDWPEAHTALAGAHRLVENGVIPEPVASESYVSMREQRHAGLRHPRTAICLAGEQESGSDGTHREKRARSDSRILILVADGRHEEAVGLSLRELAEVMLSMGCLDAVNLDGGGSSTMYLRDHGVVNHPSGNRRFDHEGERAVRTVIMIE